MDRVDLRQAVERSTGTSAQGGHLVFCANVSCLFLWRRDPTIQRAYRQTDLLTVDGMALYYASRLLGTPLPQAVSGSDLFSEVLRLADARRYRVFLLGARPDVVAEAAHRVRADYPSARLVGARDGYFSPQQEAEVVAELRAASPDIVLLGMTSPMKERFAVGHSDALEVPVMLGVGGMFDIAAGRHSRAPQWARTACLEWLWRLAQEPRRLWRRYTVTNTRFLGLLAVELFRVRSARRTGSRHRGDAG